MSIYAVKGFKEAGGAMVEPPMDNRVNRGTTGVYNIVETLFAEREALSTGKYLSLNSKHQYHVFPFELTELTNWRIKQAD